MNKEYQFVSEDRMTIGKPPAAWFVCPQCGYSGAKLPSRPELWREFQAAGYVDIREDVVDVKYIIARSDANFLKSLAVYIPAVCLTWPAYAAGLIDRLIPEFVTIGGAFLVLAIAARHQIAWGMPETETLPDESEPELEPEPLPAITEVREPKALFWFSKHGVRYGSGNQVPDHLLWRIANAYKHGVPFSKQMWTGRAKVVTRPAFEALRDAFIAEGIAHIHENGQDVILHSRARHILREWGQLDCPPIVLEDYRQVGVRKADSPTPQKDAE